MLSLVNPSLSLRPEELARYQRHIVLPQVGMTGQETLKRSRVVLVGAGGLGSPVAMYLAAAGVGAISIVDDDTVDVSNLQRQVVHGQSDIGRAKTDSARDRIAQINPHVNVIPIKARLTSANALEVLRDYEVVIDGTDNFPARYLINDACVLLDKPMVYGSIFRFEGHVSVFHASRGACYRCLHPEPPEPGLVPSCAEGGVFGVLPGIIGSIQANETIKLLLGIGEPLINRLLLFDALEMRIRELSLNKDAACPVCRARPAITELIDYEQAACAGNPKKESPMKETTPKELKQRLDRGDALTVIDVREPQELLVAQLPGTTSIPLAQVVASMKQLDPAKETVVMCRSGGRSAKAIQDLVQAGYKGTLINLKGGILAWSDEVDPTVQKY